MGDHSFILSIDKISFMIFHVFLMPCLNLANVVSKYIFLAAWILLFNLALYVFKFMCRYCILVGWVLSFNFEYNLSLYLINLSNPCFIHFDFV